MTVVRFHFTDGKSTEITIQDRKDADFLAEGLTADPNGITRINTSDGNTLIVYRAHITHIQISDAS